MANLKWKWTLIGTVTALSILSIWFYGIKLGLDLRGGVHLKIQVITDDAIKSELDDAVSRVRLQLERQKITYGSVDYRMDSALGEYQVVVAGLDADGRRRAVSVVQSALPEFSQKTGDDTITAGLGVTSIDAIRSSTVDLAKTTIEQRINQTGLTEPDVRREGTDRIMVQIPDVDDTEFVKDLIGTVAHLELKLVDSGPYQSYNDALAKHQGRIPAGLAIVPAPPEVDGEDGGSIPGEYYVVERSAVVTGRDLTRADESRDEFNQPIVTFGLNSSGAQKFGDATGKNKGRQLAIVLDGRVASAPVIQSRISDNGQIAGGFTEEEAKKLSLVLRAGALPAKIEYLEERTVGPGLGRDSIDQGKWASIAGVSLVAIMMLAYYRMAGANSVVALILNSVLLAGTLSVLGAALTLPGIAGFVLTIGMAVDANVLIFEAIRERLRNGVTPKRAIEEGFESAFITIVDTNLTTLFAAAALLLLGSGPVRGFGVTLFLGLLCSIFTAYFVSKTIFETTVLRRQWKPGDTLSI